MFRYDDQLLANPHVYGEPASLNPRIYSDPGHIVAYTDGEIRQEYEVTLLARPIDGTPAANDEASEAGWFPPDRLAELDVHPTMRRQINDYLTNQTPHID
jgi:hypothetical protein